MNPPNSKLGPVSRSAVKGSTVGMPAALIGLLVAFNVPLDQAQQLAILVFVAAAGPVLSTVTAWWTARRTTRAVAPVRNIRPDRY